MLLPMTLTRRQFSSLTLAALTAAPIGASAQTDIPVRILQAVNAQRAARGLPALGLDPRLTAAADHLASAMLRSGTMSHGADGLTLGKRAERAGYPYRRLGENIATISATSPGDLAARFVEMWMNSPPHRANILEARFRDTGISVRGRGRDVYAAQIFGLPT